MFDWKCTHLVVMYTTTILMKPDIVVELGTGLGTATEMFSDALRMVGKGIIYTVDKYPDNPQVIKTKKRLGDRENIVFITSDSVELGKKWEGKVDILYCDSDHRYKHVLNELRVWGPKSKIIFIHDIFKFNPSGKDHGELYDPYYAMIDYAKESGRKFYTFGSCENPGCAVGMII